MEKIIKKYSYILVPIVIAIISLIIRKYISDINVETLVSIAGAFIGIMITNLTLYITFITSNTNINNLIESPHHKIFINTINFGVIYFVLCLLSWIFNFFSIIIIILFLMGLTNVFISLYYISQMAKYIKKY